MVDFFYAKKSSNQKRKEEKDGTRINNMDIKDKLKLAICMSDSSYTNLRYDKPEMYAKFDNMLKEIDDEYRTTLINFAKYHLIMFAMAKIMKMIKEEQNQVALFVLNSIEL